MDNIIKKRRPEYAITEEEIKEVEERFEIVFPQVLIDFYLEHIPAKERFALENIL